VSISQAFLAEFDVEAAGTRKVLERLPEDRFDFKPHEKSPTLGWLATHLAQLPEWGPLLCAADALDLARPEYQQHREPLKTVRELVAAFDKSSAALRAALERTTDEQMAQPWSLKMGDKTFFTQPRVSVLRGMVFNHAVHHRAQLTVYLRMNGVPVPALYGPSADESPF